MLLLTKGTISESVLKSVISDSSKPKPIIFLNKQKIV